MSLTDLIVGSVWRHTATGELHTVVLVAVAGCGDSVGWNDSAGNGGGGSAIEFFNSHTLVEKSHKTYAPNP